MSTKNIPTEAFTAALQDINAAVAAFKATNPIDGGTCNFDSVVITPEGERVATLARRLVEAGFDSPYETTYFGKKCLWVPVGENAYQGGARTAIVGIAVDVLKKHGIPASIYYQMD